MIRRLAPIAVLLLAGCAPAITPRPAASLVAPPADWRTGMPASGPVEQAWWAGFGDAQLTALVERGFPTELAPNRDIGAQLQGALAQSKVN